MKRFAFSILIAVSATASLADDAVPIDGYAAVVNDRIITVGDVMAAISPVEDQLRSTYEGEELTTKRQTAFTKGLQALVEEALIVEDFKKQGGKVPDRLVNDRINEVINKRFGNDRAAFLQALAEEQVTLDEWRENIHDRLVVQMMRRQHVLDRVRIAPSKVLEIYQANIKQYVIPEKIALSLIVLNKGSTEEEREVKRQQAILTRGKLLAGSDFATLAREVSEGPKASAGGDWGWVDPSTLREELRTVAQTLETGQFSDVIEAGDAFYIVKVTNRDPGRVRTFEEVRAEIEGRLKEEEFDRLYREWITRLRSKYFVQIFKTDAEP